MKTIHLIRHAKSSWGSPSLSDVERPLNNRGKRSCKLIGPAIEKAGCPFEHVFCSIATRAQMTIQGISESLPANEATWSLVEALYTFSSQDVLDWCLELDDDLDDVVIVGHNPAFTGLCNNIGDQYINNLPTCGYVQIELPITSWDNLGSASGKTKAFITPKMLL